MGTILSTSERHHVHELLEVLAPRATDPPRSLPTLVLTYIYVARWLRVPLDPPRNAYARALFTIEQDPGELERAIEGLDPKTTRAVLDDASTFIDEKHAPALADAMARHDAIPARRLAALLARTDLPRCLALLARLDRTTDARIAYVDSVLAAYLAARKAGAVPPELAEVWHELDARPPLTWEEALVAGRLEVAALEDPLAALAALATALEDYVGGDLEHAPARVIAAAIRHDRAGVLALAEEGWPDRRATVAEAIALAEPTAPELPPLVDELLSAWEHKRGVDRSPRGTVEFTLPLLATTILIRDDVRARKVVATLQPSRFMLNVATWAPMRRVNLADQRWRPGLWDELAAETQGPDEHGVPSLTEAEYAAWWKLDTLPLVELLWFQARAKP